MTDYNNDPFGVPLNVNYQPTSGDSPGMNNDNPRGAYALRQRKAPRMTTGRMQGASGVPNLNERARERAEGER